MLNNMENGQKNKQGNYRFTDDYLPLLVFLLCLAVGLTPSMISLPPRRLIYSFHFPI